MKVIDLVLTRLLNIDLVKNKKNREKGAPAQDSFHTKSLQHETEIPFDKPANPKEERKTN